jgi:hypothetical protein
MLRTAELTGAMAGDNFHDLHWSSRLEFCVDCFVCERTGRTKVYERGAERLALRALVGFWWAPFKDARDDKPVAIRLLG